LDFLLPGIIGGRGRKVSGEGLREVKAYYRSRREEERAKMQQQG
jgi:hypothetical protein